MPERPLSANATHRTHHPTASPEGRTFRRSRHREALTSVRAPHRRWAPGSLRGGSDDVGSISGPKRQSDSAWRGRLAIACGRANLRDHGAAHGGSWWGPDGCALLCRARCAAEWHGADVSADERLPFVAMAEAPLQPTPASIAGKRLASAQWEPRAKPCAAQDQHRGFGRRPPWPACRGNAPNPCRGRRIAPRWEDRSGSCAARCRRPGRSGRSR